jgi:hypothetical protein
MEAPWRHHVLAHTPSNQLIIIGVCTVSPERVCVGGGAAARAAPMVPPSCDDVRLEGGEEYRRDVDFTRSGVELGNELG